MTFISSNNNQHYVVCQQSAFLDSSTNSLEKEVVCKGKRNSKPEELSSTALSQPLLCLGNAYSSLLGRNPRNSHTNNKAKGLSHVHSTTGSLWVSCSQLMPATHPCPGSCGQGPKSHQVLWDKDGTSWKWPAQQCQLPRYSYGLQKSHTPLTLAVLRSFQVKPHKMRNQGGLSQACCQLPVVLAGL